MSKPHIDVFISSTSIDLPEYRQVVKEAILDLDFFPNGMENWPVTGENPVDLCKKMVFDSEVYLGIFAYRYGWKPDGYSGKSITEMEYDWAGEVIRDGKPIPRLCFIMRDDHPWPTDRREPEAEAELKRFKARLKANHAGFFTTPDNLKAQVTAALANILAARRARDVITWESRSQFDNYTLRDVLGMGGNGQVWLTDEHLPDGSSRPVAIKVLRSGISEKPTRVTRFKREISNMARISHDHIVPIYTYGDRGGQLYVIMPYLGGGTLREKLTGNPLPFEQALRWLAQIGGALDYVHDRHSGLIHRDVKPENILLRADDDMLYLADFGLVFSTDDSDERLTDDGKPAGTGRYMAPEQWRGLELSRRTDLYALGILAYELLTGHLPFQHTNDLDLGNAHCEQPLPADAALSSEVLKILHKATSKNPADRYPTARAFLTDLRNWEIDPANLEPRIRDYLRWVTDELYDGLRAQFVELAGDETHQRLSPTKPQMPTWMDEDDLFARASATVHADHVTPDETGRTTFIENVRERLSTLTRAVLIGEPGSGKTWMLQRLQADCARRWLQGETPLIPVLIRLNQYGGGEFVDFVRAALDILAPYHDQLLRDNRLILLCDALNEMPRKDGQMTKLINYLKNAPYFVVSCRVRDYKDDLSPLKPLEQVLLHDLEFPAIYELIHKKLPHDAASALWQAIGGNETLFKFWQEVNQADAGKHFWDAKTDWWLLRKRPYIPHEWDIMHQGTRLIPLSRNPYMGDLLCRTYQESGGVLPDSRAALFGKFIGQMLSREAKAAARRGEPFPDVTIIQEALVALAQVLQDRQTTVLSPDDALRAMNDPALLRAALDANILSQQDDEVKFAHQLLQEYFAAKIMLEKMEADETEGTHRRAAALFGDTWWDAGAWRETTVILGEFLGDGARGANRAARWLAPVTPEVALQLITRNAAGLTLADVEDETRAALIAGANHLTNEPNPVGRAAAYRVLGLFNADKRPGIGVIVRNGVILPDIDWVTIPEGEFIYGDDNKTGYANFADPADKQILTLPTFQISCYPITHAQFQVFLDDVRNDYDHWLDGLVANESQKQMRDQYFKYTNHPRERVNWYQAMAFCYWFSVKLGGETDLGEIIQWTVRLPTVFEWEKAARGTQGLIYPYGNEFDANKSNTHETGIGQTSAVGIFPQGASPYGVQDMSGNIWEWCLTDYNNPASSIAENGNVRSSPLRVLRGGSWADDGNFACAASQNGDFPDFGNYSYGFRIVYLPYLAQS